MRARRLIDSFNYAIDGLIYVLRTQRNMRIHFSAALLVLIAAIAFGLTRLETLVLVLTILLVITAEMINTAVEAAVDLITGSYHPLARIAKNVAAGAVLVAAIGAFFVGFLIFFDKLDRFSTAALDQLSRTPTVMLALATGVVLLLVVIGKAFSTKGTFLRGGMPSGHSALAFCLATWIALASKSGLTAVICLFLAALVAETRVDARIHTFYEALVGSVLGILISALVFSLTRGI